MSESRVRENRMHGLIGGRWPTGKPDETHEQPEGQRAVPDDTPNNQRPTSPFPGLVDLGMPLDKAWPRRSMSLYAEFSTKTIEPKRSIGALVLAGVADGASTQCVRCCKWHR